YQGAFLVGSILLFFLRDFISTSFICLSIPLSLVMTLAAMSLFGLSLNIMTISGLAIASGQVVDTSICVLENILSHKSKFLRFLNRWDKRDRSGSGNKIPSVYQSFVKLDKGGQLLVSEKEANKSLALTASNEMFMVLVANTLTCIVVFLPIVFLNPQVKILYLGLAVTVTAALIVSLLIAITIIPSLSANISRKWIQQSSFFSTYLWLLLGNKIKQGNILFNRWYYKILVLTKKYRKKKQGEDDLVYGRNAQKSLFKKGGGLRIYRRIVAWLMRRRYWVALATLLALIGSGFMYKFLDKEFVGSSEDNEFIIFVELPSGAKLDVSDKIVADVEKVLNQTAEVQKSVKTSIARVEGWSSKIYVTLLPREERARTTQDVMKELRPLVQGIGKEYDAFIYFSEPVSSKEFVIDVFGYDYNNLRDLAVKIAQALEKVEGLADTKLRYKPGRPEVKIEVDREKASLFDFTIHDIAESLHAQIRGLRATYFITPTAQIETVARLQEQYRKTLEDVQNLTLVNNKGTVVSVRQFAVFTFGLTPSEIWRKDRERMIQVSANRGDISLSKVAEKSLQALKSVQLPTGYYYEIGGDFPKMIETEKESRFAFIIMVALVYSILAALFESYSQPIIILLAVPLSVIGAIPLLLISHTPVTLGTLIGFIMLGGIAVNNSTILVEVFNNLHEEKNMLRALLESGQARLSPIFATTLTNVSGMLPLIFQGSDSGSLWAPMAITVIGGLITSTILILFVLPGFYLILEDCKRWMGKNVTRMLQKVEEKFLQTLYTGREVKDEKVLD
ncbi:MAG: efflux RND transporter permease subunit, partial [Elusimicrobia bacterium]|nr:efflux RND transporter permease subunit [Elusimicrobiota bacterium]